MLLQTRYHAAKTGAARRKKLEVATRKAEKGNNLDSSGTSTTEGQAVGGSPLRERRR